MHDRLYRLIAVLLLTMLPWQGFATATMLSCARTAAPARSVAPCHEAMMGEHPGAAHDPITDLGDWSACSGCAQCHACSASVLPVTAGSAVAPSPLQPAFAPPAPIAGVVLEHVDPPPVG